MRAPTRPKRLVSSRMQAAAISACSRSAPAQAPSSQSQVMSNTGPIWACSCSAFFICFSLPA
ncbi:MAG: hypothetical protein QM765_40290 [Myxococcales bacterium]